MKYYLIIIGVFFSMKLSGQGIKKATTKNEVVIIGNVKNQIDNFWEFQYTGNIYTGNSVAVPLDSKGNFYKKISIDDGMQNIYLGVEDNLTISIQKNDTIKITWDAKDYNHTIKIKNTNPVRNAEMQTEMLIDRLYKKDLEDLGTILYDEKQPDSVKASKINSFYNKEIDTLYKMKIATYRIGVDIYFKYASLMFSHNLFPKYNLAINDTAGKELYQLALNKNYYKSEMWDAFRNSANYRAFLFNYLRMNTVVNPEPLYGPPIKEQKMAPFSPGWDNYYTGLASLHNYEIRDWFITNSILFDFEYYSFDDASAIYKEFMLKVKTPVYADLLKKYYIQVQHLKPGSIAPDFSLKNEKGQNVSLKDFRGKVVLIDFWGVYCATCLQDIKEYLPAVHNRYKDRNIVFLNICVDVSEQEWKKNLAQLKLDGVNLIAPGWAKNPVCIKYGIKGIPHYVIIDSNGRIADNNSPRPYDSISLYDKLDKLISK